MNPPNENAKFARNLLIACQNKAPRGSGWVWSSAQYHSYFWMYGDNEVQSCLNKNACAWLYSGCVFLPAVGVLDSKTLLNWHNFLFRSDVTQYRRHSCRWARRRPTATCWGRAPRHPRRRTRWTTARRMTWRCLRRRHHLEWQEGRKTTKLCANSHRWVRNRPYPFHRLFPINEKSLRSFLVHPISLYHCHLPTTVADRAYVDHR